MARDGEEEIVIVVGGGPKPRGLVAGDSEAGEIRVKVTKPAGVSVQDALLAALAAVDGSEASA